MADSTMTDVTKMRVIDLRKELKARGLVSTGDKTELVARLQASLAEDSQDEHGDITLDSDEIDSDGVLDEDDKSHNDILDDTEGDVLNEELTLADPTPPPPAKSETKPPHRTLKRKIAISVPAKDKSDTENKEGGHKKIVLNRTTSITSTVPAPAAESTEEEKPKVELTETNKVKITADLDSKSKLELRAKRFGIPVQMTEAERKEARKLRFGSGNLSTTTISNTSGTLSENLDKLKKRSERFGQSVSKIMTAIEDKEKIEKRKAKFGTVQ